MIYSVPYGSGTLYAMKHINPSKTHSSLDKNIVSLDKMISKHATTSFVSISNVLSGKIKTFQRGEHSIDEHYNAIFSNRVPGGRQRYELHPGVKTWTPETIRNEDALAQSARQEDDMSVQAHAMEEDPSAFGVDANDIIHSPEVPKKRHAEPSNQQTTLDSEDEFSRASPKRRLADPNFNQQKLECYFKGTDDKLDKIHIDNVETAKFTSKCLLEINDNVVNNHTVSNGKLDGVTQLVIDSHTKIDSMNKTVADFVEQQDDLSALIHGRDHYEKMYYKVRGILAANATRENKPIHAELAESKAREANMTLQLADLNQIGTDIMSIDAFMGEKDERDKRVEQDIAKLKAGQVEIKAALSSLEERDKRVEQDITKLKAGQSEIKQMLAILLSKA